MGSQPLLTPDTSTESGQSAVLHDRRTIRLHWVTAALVAALWSLAQIIDDFPKGLPRVSARSTHILLGVLLAIVVVQRIRWRMQIARSLPLPGPLWLSALAKAAHRLLYIGLVAVIVLGLVNAWTRGDSLYGLVSIPKLLPGQPQLKPMVELLHKYLANALVIVATLHALAALGHHFLLKDNVLRRMIGR